MSITATRTPAALAWSNFTTAAVVIDPHDGTPQDALTLFDFAMPDLPPRTVDGRQALAAGLTMTLTPRCRVWTGVAQTAGLLAHEQVHWDLAFVIARRFAAEAGWLRAATQTALAAEFQGTFRLHFHTRNRILQSRYDRESRHGTSAHYQGVWRRAVTDALADPQATQLLGWML